MRSAGWMEQSWSPNTNFISTSDKPRTAEPHVCRIASRWEKWSLADNTPKMSRFDGTFAVNHYILQYQESCKNNCYCLHTLNWSGSPTPSLQGNTDSWLNSWLCDPFIQPISSNGYGRWGGVSGSVWCTLFMITLGYTNVSTSNLHTSHMMNSSKTSYCIIHLSLSVFSWSSVYNASI